MLQFAQIIPRFGPLNGRIAVTIRGSNIGIKKEDVKSIKVADVNCVHLAERYSVSTRSVYPSPSSPNSVNSNSVNYAECSACFCLPPSVVCEIGPAKRAAPGDIPFEPTLSGVVTVTLEGNRNGSSEVIFTYRVGHMINTPPLCCRRKLSICAENNIQTNNI